MKIEHISGYNKPYLSNTKQKQKVDNDSYLSEHAKIENNIGAIIRIIFEYNAKNIKPGTGIHILFKMRRLRRNPGTILHIVFLIQNKTRKQGP